MDQPCLEQQCQRILKTKNGCCIKFASHPVHKTLATAANLANLLPTGTVLAFRTLAPSFSNKGICQPSNRFLTASLVGICAVFCFVSSFTDSFVDCDGKFCYGIATFKGFYVFNNDESRNQEEEEDTGERREEGPTTKEMSKLRISCIDVVHAFVTLFVFLIHAVSDSDVQNCFFPRAGGNVDALLMNLPLGAAILSSCLFIVFPTTRRGIGYADLPTSVKCTHVV